MHTRMLIAAVVLAVAAAVVSDRGRTAGTRALTGGSIGAAIRDRTGLGPSTGALSGSAGDSGTGAFTARH